MSFRLFQRKIASAFPVFAMSVLSTLIAGQAYAQVAGGPLSGTVIPQAHILVKNRLDLPKFEVDPFWPKPLPDDWVIGGVGGVCVDAQDHVFVMTSRAGELTETEQKIATEAPPIIEFDPDGKVINSWGDRNVLPGTELHGCFVDRQSNLWISGSQDGIVQKYSHDGSKMLLQIGTRGKFDSSDGTAKGAATNSSHVLLNAPTSVAVDPANGDVYVADGYGNRRVVVFDRNGSFLRQWGRQATEAETDAGVGGVFQAVVHCVAIGNDGLVYVCDRFGDRIEVFDKMGNFRKNIPVESKNGRKKGVGPARWIAFSPDEAQKFMYVADFGHDAIRVIDHATGQTLEILGRTGHQTGEFEGPHMLIVDSKGNIVVGESGHRVQMFRLVGN
jgi:6-phosphogluconolactonase (cycloisomerase 2 family)